MIHRLQIAAKVLKERNNEMKIKEKFKWMPLILAAVVLIFSGIAYARQGQPPSPPSATDIVDRMQQDLDLTDEQVRQITPIIEDEVKQMQAIMRQGPDGDRSKMEKLHEETESKLSQYLTEEQLAKWKNQRRRPPQGKGNKMGPPPGR